VVVCQALQKRKKEKKTTTLKYYMTHLLCYALIISSQIEYGAIDIGYCLVTIHHYIRHAT